MRERIDTGSVGLVIRLFASLQHAFPGFVCLLLLPFSLAVPSSSAGEIFVSSSGKDSAPGTRTKPLNSLQAACDIAQPGDTILVGDGIYHEHLEVNVSGDEKAGPIMLKAANRHKAILEGTDGIRDVIQIMDQSHVHVIGFEIRNHSSDEEASGIRVEGSGTNIEIRDNLIHEIRGKHAMGITVYGTSAENALSKIVIDGNTIRDCDPAKSEALVLNGNIEGFEVTNNLVQDVNNIGIDFIGGEESIVSDPNKVTRNGVCKGNQVFRARSNYGGGYAAGIYVDGARNILIEENVVSECDMGIEIGAENAGAKASDIRVRNNRIYANDKAAIVVGGYSEKAGIVRNCIIEQNICYRNTGHRKSEAEIWIQIASGVTFSNNTIVGSGTGKPLLRAERGSDKNTLQENTWYAPEKDDAVFDWLGKELAGLAAFQDGASQGLRSEFRLPTFSDPDAGDFTRVEKPLPVE